MLISLKMFFFIWHRNHVDGIHWFCVNFDQVTNHVPSMEWCSFLQIIEICLLIRHEPTTALGWNVRLMIITPSYLHSRASFFVVCDWINIFASPFLGPLPLPMNPNLIWVSGNICRISILLVRLVSPFFPQRLAWIAAISFRVKKRIHL